MSLFSNIRFYVLLVSFFISIVVLLFASTETAELQSFAFLSIIFLYVTLLAGPLTKVFPTFRYKAAYIKARRALGVSTFYFALLHYIHGIEYLGGPEGMLNLPQEAQLIAFMGTISVFILFLLAITSFDYAVSKLTFKWWKMLHRLVYVAGFLILTHAYTWGSHFQDRLSFVSISTACAIIFLVILHILATKKKLSKPQGVSNT